MAEGVEVAAGRRVYAVDGLRFALALAVLVFHYVYYGLRTVSPETPDPIHWITLLRYAVEAFFMISGFVIMMTLQGRTALQFAAARFLRLWPALLVCACATTALLYLGNDAIQPHSLKRLAAAIALLPLVNWNGLVDGAYWSLVFELRFYLMILALMLVISVPKRMLTVLTVWLAVIAVNALAPGNRILNWIALDFYGPSFAAGALTYVIWTNRPGRIWAALLLPAAIALQGVLLISDCATKGDPVLCPPVLPDFRLWFVAPLSWCLLAACVWGPQPRRGGQTQTTLLALGAASYPLYLIHADGPIVLVHALEHVMPAPLAYALIGLADIAFALAVALLVEPAIRTWLKRGWAWLTRVAPRAAAPAREPGN